MLTPHIIRVLDLTEDDLRPLRLPSEGSNISLEPPAPTEPRAASPALMPPPETPAPPPETPAPPPTVRTP